MSLKTRQAKQNFQGNIIFIHWQQMPNPTSLSAASTVQVPLIAPKQDYPLSRTVKLQIN